LKFRCWYCSIRYEIANYSRGLVCSLYLVGDEKMAPAFFEKF
jgi:hypothetical protein